MRELLAGTIVDFTLSTITTDTCMLSEEPEEKNFGGQ